MLFVPLIPFFLIYGLHSITVCVIYIIFHPFSAHSTRGHGGWSLSHHHWAKVVSRQIFSFSAVTPEQSTSNRSSPHCEAGHKGPVWTRGVLPLPELKKQSISTLERECDTHSAELGTRPSCGGLRSVVRTRHQPGRSLGRSNSSTVWPGEASTQLLSTTSAAIRFRFDSTRGFVTVINQNQHNP